MSSEGPKIYDIGELVEVTQGLAINAKTKHLFRDEGLPLLQITDMFSDNYSQFISEKDVPKQCVANKDELIYTRTGQVGFIFTNKVGVVHNNCFKVTPKDLRVSRRYLYWFLRQESVYKYVNSVASGSVQKDLNHSAFKTLKIPVPDIKSQHAIDDILKPLDDRITLLRETNSTLEAIAQALFKSWFVDFDPVRAKMEGRAPEGMDEATAALFPDGLEESELGVVPMGWRIGTLADLSDLNPESWTARKHPQTVAYVDLANAKDNEISTITDFAFADAPSRARRVLRTGDTIVGTVRPGNRSFAFIHEPVNNLTGSTGFAVLRPTKVENTEYVFLAATQDTSIEHLAHVADGGAYPAVRPDVVIGLSCVIPDAEALQRFHSVTETLLAKVSENQKQAQTLATLRDTLLPRLISGQLRLPEAQAQIEELAA